MCDVWFLCNCGLTLLKCAEVAILLMNNLREKFWKVWIKNFRMFTPQLNKQRIYYIFIGCWRSRGLIYLVFKFYRGADGSCKKIFIGFPRQSR